jgi:hypothetical protein
VVVALFVSLDSALSFISGGIMSKSFSGICDRAGRPLIAFKQSNEAERAAIWVVASLGAGSECASLARNRESVPELPT